MQRSRKALLLERRALGKPITTGNNHFYKVSISLVFVLWGLLFLFSLWISRGHGYTGISFWLSSLTCAVNLICLLLGAVLACRLEMLVW